MTGSNSGEGSLAALSLNSMQLAIISLKDKYNQKHKQVEILESERNQLKLSKENLYNELKKLHEANEKLREQNLKLSSDLEQKSKECSHLCQRLQDHGIQEYSRLSEQSESTLSNKYNRLSGNADSSIYTTSEFDKDGLNSRLTDVPVNLPNVEENAPEKVIIDQLANNFASIRNKIKTDQVKLLQAMRVLQENRDKSDRSANKLFGTIKSWNSLQLKGTQSSDGEATNSRKCPMCEAEFPLNTSQDEFELHVVEHFSYDESETLKNFDTLPDAYWKGKNEDPERSSQST